MRATVTVEKRRGLRPWAVLVNRSVVAHHATRRHANRAVRIITEAIAQTERDGKVFATQLVRETMVKGAAVLVQFPGLLYEPPDAKPS